MTKRLRSTLSRAIDHLDVTLAISGCVLAVPLTIYLHAAMRSPVFVVVGVIVFLTCLAYLLIRRRRSALVRTQPEATPRVYLLLNILFFGLLTYSILAFYLRPEPYTRPMGYFVALAAMAAVLAVEILFLPQSRRAAHLAIVKVTAVGLSLAWSQLLLYPGMVGNDPWYHQWFTMSILDAGHIPLGHQYSWMPGMHLVIGGTALVTGLDYKLATMLSVSLFQVAGSILFVFLLGRIIHSARAGLIAALVVCISSLHLVYAYTTIPNSMAMVFIPIVIYVLFRLRQQNPGVSVALSALFMATVILTHNMAAVMLGVGLFCVWLGFEIHRRFRYQGAAGARILLVAAILFTGATLSYWTVPGYTGTLRFLAQIGFRGGDYFDRLPPGDITPPPGEVTPLPEDAALLAMAVAHYHDHIVPLAERLFNQLGFLIFFGFGIAGALVILSRRSRNRSGFAFVFAGLVILAVAFFGIITHRIFLEERWNHLSQVLLAVPVGVGLLWLAGLPGRKAIGGGMIAIMVFALSFLMIMTPPANADNRALSPNTVFRGGFAQSELQAFRTVHSFYDGQLGIERYNARSLRLTLSPDDVIAAIDVQLVTGDFGECRNSLVLIRSEVASEPFVIRGGVFRLDYDPLEALTEQGFSRIYDGGSVSGFTWIGEEAAD